MATRKIWVFRLITVLVPVLFFILIEVTLRLFGYGNSYPLFINTPDSPNYILGRPDIIKRYFPENANIPSVTMEASLFLQEKPANGLRIFVQGGSTAAGFPYGFGASPAGMLDQRLKQTFPDKHVEVINTALSAINTYTILDLVDEIIEQQPDAVLLYTGHNEYLGIMGVGSNYSALGSRGANLAFLLLKDLRFFQLLQNAYVSLTSESGEYAPDSHEQSRTFMAKVAKEQNIALGSDLYQAGLNQFEQNLAMILDKYQAAGIPVYLATIASNLKDQKPFASTEIETNTKVQLNRIMQIAQTGASKAQIVSLANAIVDNESNSLSAEVHFMIGKALEISNNASAAKSYFINAKDLDLLRFRAPEEFNRIIKNQAKREGVYLVDFEANLTKKSPFGLIGKEFMLEHLHPNLQGYFVLADSFYFALLKHSLSNIERQLITTDKAWKYRPVLPAEEYFGFAQIIQLMSDYPFTDVPQEFVLPRPGDWQQKLGLKHFSKEIDWITMISDSYRGYVKERNYPMILKSAQIIADAVPHNDKANYEFGRLLIQDGRKAEAKLYLNRALLEQPNNSLYQRAYQSVSQ